jgi:hypothetical protein
LTSIVLAHATGFAPDDSESAATRPSLEHFELRDHALVHRIQQPAIAKFAFAYSPSRALQQYALAPLSRNEPFGHLALGIMQDRELAMVADATPMGHARSPALLLRRRRRLASITGVRAQSLWYNLIQRHEPLS